MKARLVWALGVAGLLTWWVSANFGAKFVLPLVILPVVIGTVVSGNVHDPTIGVATIALYAQNLFIGFAVVWLIGKLLKARRPAKSAE